MGILKTFFAIFLMGFAMSSYAGSYFGSYPGSYKDGDHSYGDGDHSYGDHSYGDHSYGDGDHSYGDHQSSFDSKSSDYCGTQPPSVVTSVPEPSTYALMGLGLGLVGFMARRRRNK